MNELAQAFIELNNGNDLLLRQVIDKITKERDEFMTQANIRLSFFTGQIELLSKQLAQAEGTAANGTDKGSSKQTEK